MVNCGIAGHRPIAGSMAKSLAGSMTMAGCSKCQPSAGAGAAPPVSVRGCARAERSMDTAA
jgi:hypothetical protein